MLLRTTSVMIIILMLSVYVRISSNTQTNTPKDFHCLRDYSVI